MTDNDNKYELDEEDVLVEKSSSATPSPYADEMQKLLKKQQRDVLTQRVIDRARPREKEYTIPHKTMTGFGLRVRPSGYKSFILVYKRRNSKTSERHTIGDANTITLEKAEKLAYIAIQNVREYGDPNGMPHETKQWTLDNLFASYIAEHGRTALSENWRNQSKQLYRDYIQPDFGKRFVHTLTRGELVRCIKYIRSPYVQHNVQRVMSSMFSWSIDMEYVTENIVRGVKLANVKSRDRFLNDLEISSVWNASYQLSTPFGEYGRFVMMSGQRRNEVAHMTWDEVDLEQKVWTLPEKRSKNKHSHTIPLTDEMIELLNSLPRSSKHVFNSPYNDGYPINSFSQMDRLWRKNTWVKEWRLHDLRRTLASGMAGLGIAPHVIEATLNHRSGIVSGIAAVYNRYKYEKEKREALELWQAHIAKIAVQHKDYAPPPEEDYSDCL